MAWLVSTPALSDSPPVCGIVSQEENMLGDSVFSVLASRWASRFIMRAAGACVVSMALLGVASSTASARSAPQPIGDRDGDGKTDKVVWRPSEGKFYWLSSRTGGGFWAGWGTVGDIPISGDFDGDHLGDWAIWRPSTG